MARDLATYDDRALAEVGVERDRPGDDPFGRRRAGNHLDERDERGRVEGVADEHPLGVAGAHRLQRGGHQARRAAGDDRVGGRVRVDDPPVTTSTLDELRTCAEWTFFTREIDSVMADLSSVEIEASADSMTSRGTRKLSGAMPSNSREISNKSRSLPFFTRSMIGSTIARAPFTSKVARGKSSP